MGASKGLAVEVYFYSVGGAFHTEVVELVVEGELKVHSVVDSVEHSYSSGFEGKGNSVTVAREDGFGASAFVGEAEGTFGGVET